MKSNPEPTAVTVARAHIQAWSHHDFDKARAGLAPGVHVRAMTTQDLMKGETDLRGVDPYMEGLRMFAQAVQTGSAKNSDAGMRRDAGQPAQGVSAPPAPSRSGGDEGAYAGALASPIERLFPRAEPSPGSGRTTRGVRARR